MKSVRKVPRPLQGAIILVALLLQGVPLAGQAPRGWVRDARKPHAGIELWSLTSEQPLRAYAVLADVSRADLELRPMVSRAPDGKESVSSLARRSGALVAVNASYFKMKARPSQVVGWLVVDGRTLAKPVASVMRRDVLYPVARACLLWDDRDGLRMTWVREAEGHPVELRRPVPNRNLRPARRSPTGTPLSGVRNAVGAGPMLVHAGEVDVTRDEEVLFAGRDDRHPRTAIGLVGKKVVLLVVEGRSSLSRGATLLQLARMMKAWGARQAMNLDGGGSSTLVVGGHLVNQIAGRASERKVPAALGIFATKPASRPSKAP